MPTCQTAVVVEQFLASKTGDEALNGDALVVTPEFIAVVDGATPKVRARDGARLDALSAALVVQELRALPPDSTFPEAVARITARLGAEARLLELPEGVNPDVALIATAAIVSVRRREVWAIGDCAFRTSSGSAYSGGMRIDQAMAEARALVNAMHLAAGKGTLTELMASDPGREFIKPMLAAQSLFLNQDNGSPYEYGALCGIAPPSRFLQIVRLPEDPVEVVLGTDGYPALLPTLDLSEAYLHDILARDPLLIGEVKSTKGLAPGCQSFDDRAYVRLRL